MFLNLHLKFHLFRFSINRAKSSNIAGFVGGCIWQDKRMKDLTHGLKFIDQTYMSSSLKDKITNYNLFRRCRDIELHYSTFEQRNFAVAFSPLDALTASVLTVPLRTAEDTVINVGRNSIRRCVGMGVLALQRRGVSEIFVDPCGNAELAAEGAFLASFVYDELKSIGRQTIKPHISCYTDHLEHGDCSGYPEAKSNSSVIAAWNRGTELAMAQNLARKFMEMPANLLYPETFARQASELFEGIASVKTNVRDADWCRRQGLNGLLAVGAGSVRPVCFLELIYEGDPSRCPNHVALVGKGVTFDAGGISIKPSAGMEDMRADMGGGAVVVATVFGLARLNVPINVRAYIPLCENMPSGRALRPGDVIRMANGATVQVDNTDAEGRLILADALHMSTGHPDLVTVPTLIIDVATLTGAVGVALADHYVGAFYNTACNRTPLSLLWNQPLHSSFDHTLNLSNSNNNHDSNATNPSVNMADGTEADDDSEVDGTVSVDTALMMADHSKMELNRPREHTLTDCMRASGLLRGDLTWNLPLIYADAIRDDAHLADLVNVLAGSKGKLGGSGVAASFLSKFVPRHIPWIHLDIAGVMKTDSRVPYMRKGMTGRPTRTLIEFLHRLSQV